MKIVYCRPACDYDGGDCSEINRQRAEGILDRIECEKISPNYKDNIGKSLAFSQ